jgi:hypothetical protein
LHRRSGSIAQMQRESRGEGSVLRRKLPGFSGCAGRLDSPKVLRFSMDINSCLAREPGVSLLWWSERRRSVSLRILWERMWRVEIGDWSCGGCQCSKEARSLRKEGRGKRSRSLGPVPASLATCSRLPIKLECRMGNDSTFHSLDGHIHR